MSDTLLRGAAAVASEQSEELNGSFSTHGFFRMLHGTDEGHEHTSDKNDEHDAFLMFMTVIVGMICFCYVICMIQLIRMCFCRRYRENVDQANVLVRDGGVIFNLTGLQRRAVLEAIFSETSKAVTKDEFLKKKEEKAIEKGVPVKKDEKEEDEGTVPDIPLSSTKDTLKTAADEVPDLEASNGSYLSPAASLASSFSPEEPTSLLSTPTGASEGLGISNSDTPEFVKRNFSWQECSPEEPDLTLPMSPSDDASCLPSLSEEECKEEEEECKEEEPAELPSDAAVASMDSIAENRSNDYDFYESDDDENLCAICLSSYQEGEVLVTSKYCSHLFHKECIFEWLEKHDVCPCCRVEMVTAGEINRAATTLVGKQRMCKAIQTRTAATLQTPPASPSALNRARSPRVRRVGQSYR